MSTTAFGPSSTTTSLILLERFVSLRSSITVPSSSIVSVDVATSCPAGSDSQA